MRKGQGALEYLMTYGWALLVIVVVGAALYSMGILNPSSYQGTEGCRTFGYFNFNGIKFNTTSVELDITNGGQAINITGIQVGSSIIDADLGGTIAPGAATRTQVLVMGTGHIPSKNSGDSFSETVTIRYDVTDGLSNQEDSATCTGTIA